MAIPAAQPSSIPPTRPAVAIVYSVAFSFIGIDLIMALEPDWFSTLFGGWYFIGNLFAGLALLAVAAMSLWLAWPQLGRGGSALPPLLLTAAALGLACIGGLAATTAAGASRVSVVVMSALALAGAAFQAGSLSLMQVALSLAAAGGGSLMEGEGGAPRVFTWGVNGRNEVRSICLWYSRNGLGSL